MSHARNHFLRVTAAQEVTVEQPQDHGRASAYELMLAQLAEHKRRLKGIQSIEQRADMKRTYLDDYQPWVTGVLDGDSGQPDIVLTTVMVWMIDVGDIKAALPLARYALKHGLAMPDQYQRNLATVLAEESAEQALRVMAVKDHAPIDLQQLTEVAQLVDGQDMPDQVRAKLYKAIGYALREQDYLSASLGYLERAYQLHDKCGVKKDIEVLRREVEKGKGQDLPATAATPGDDEEPTPAAPDTPGSGE